MEIFILLVFLHFKKLVHKVKPTIAFLSGILFKNILFSIFHKSTSTLIKIVANIFPQINKNNINFPLLNLIQILIIAIAKIEIFIISEFLHFEKLMSKKLVLIYSI